MNNWKIHALTCGRIEVPKGAMACGLDNDLMMWIPYTAYLLQNGKQNILVDNGIHGDHIVDGRAWRGCRAEGGANMVLEELERYNLRPKDIDTVIYTHLHNDHAGNALLFKDALTIYQKDEYLNLFHQLPMQRKGGDFDDRTPGDLAQLKNKLVIDGDVHMANGISIYKTPGHSLGSQVLTVPTAEGTYIITGDTPHLLLSLFPKEDTYELMGGEIVDITPAPDDMMPFLFNSVIYDQFSAYDSFSKILAMAPEPDKKWFLTGHDPWITNKRDFG